jgi:hypothetical protein
MTGRLADLAGWRRLEGMYMTWKEIDEWIEGWENQGFQRQEQNQERGEE